MKFLGKVLFTLLILILLVIIAGYILLQMRWGAGWVSRQLSDASGLQVQINQIEHDFSHPDHLILHDVTLSSDQQSHLLVAQRVDLGLALTQFSDPTHFASILLSQGSLTPGNTHDLSLQADKLQLSQMSVSSTQNGQNIQATQVNGGIIPWQPAKTEQPTYKAMFRASAGSLVVNGIPAANALIEGQVENQQWNITRFGMDVARGSVTARAKRDADGLWDIANLRLNNIRLQSDKTAHDFLQPLSSLPDMQLGRVDITDARLEGDNWAVTDLDLVLKNIRLQQGNWQSDDGSLEMNASSLIQGSLKLNDPIISLNLSSQGIALTRFSSRWEKGLLRTQGYWDRHEKALILDEVVIAGLEYTLPPDWHELWMAPLPNWLNSVTVKKLSASRNLLIDINPEFPFQITSLEGSGSDLLLAKNQQWGMWSGNLDLNAMNATFNRVDLRHPSLTLSADNHQLHATEFSAFNGNGILEGTATASQNADRQVTFQLQGRQTDSRLLPHWGWSWLTALQGNSNFQLNGQISLQQGLPLKSSLSAMLNLTTDSAAIQQKIMNGEMQ